MHYIRAQNAGATYFFTLNLRDRKSQLLTQEINKLRMAFRRVQHRYPFKIDAVVILPDHIHMLMTLPENDSNYSLRLNLIKGYFSKQIARIEPISVSRKNKRERGIWQRRFWEHFIRDEADYLHHVNYIHYNPVKHGYVLKPTGWRYSSIHRFIKLGVLPDNWACDVASGIVRYGE